MTKKTHPAAVMVHTLPTTYSFILKVLSKSYVC